MSPVVELTLQSDDGRIEALDVADSENEPAGLSVLDDGKGILLARRHRLLNQHMDFSREDLMRAQRQLNDGDGDRGEVEASGPERFVQAFIGTQSRPRALGGRSASRVGVHDSGYLDTLQCEQDTQVVRAHDPETDDQAAKRATPGRCAGIGHRLCSLHSDVQDIPAPPQPEGAD